MSDTALAPHRARVWAPVATVVFLVLAALVLARADVLDDMDAALGADPQGWTAQHEWLRQTALVVQLLFSFWPMTAYTVITVGLLAARNHRRAALWTAIVMVASTVLVTVLKPLVGRQRPHWTDPITTLRSLSFPSGHATSIAAAAGVTVVLSLMLVRRHNLRRLLIGAALVVALLVGADRILLGVHHVSDVLAGWALGAAVVLWTLAFYDPLPRSIALTTEALPEVYPSEHRQLAVVLNPVKVDDPGGFRSMVEQMAEESGFAEVFWYETTVDDPGHSQAHQAAVGGADLVITCGGDGTVRTVCEELAGTGVPVGIVPAGTGNLLARNLALPLYLRAAVDIALNGQDRAIDMVEVAGDGMDDTTYLVMAGMGLDAALMGGVNEEFKARVGWIAYVLSGIRSMMFPSVRVDISVDGGEFTRHRARMVLVGNVGFLQGGMPLIPDAQIDDGELDVVLLNPRRFLSWLPLAVRLLGRSRRTDQLVDRMSGREIVVRAASEQPRQLDGDLIEPGRELHCRCVHGRLLVRVPR